VTEGERLIALIQTGNPGEQLDAAEALERLSRLNRLALNALRLDLLHLVHTAPLPSVQWHLAEIIPRLAWNSHEAGTLIAVFCSWIETSESVIVKADALSAVSFLAHQHAEYMPIAKRYLARALRFGSPAEQARARKLIDRVEHED
jgi:hypothetical protein